MTFTDAIAQIDAAIAADRADPRIAATGLPRCWHHGSAVEHAVVLFHGFTTVPQQFVELGERLHARGCNVLVPRIDEHGYADRLTHALNALTVDAIDATTAAAYRLARGLGERVTVIGLSLGGTMALRLAQTEAVDHAIAIAPFLMPIGTPDRLGRLAMAALARLPSWYQWWDPRVKDACPPPYAYPGFPTHGLVACIRFGRPIIDASRTSPARAARVTLVTHCRESAVNDGLAEALVRRWAARASRTEHVSLGDLGPPRHDIIDPTTFPEARTRVYPTIEALVLDRVTDPSAARSARSN